MESNQKARIIHIDDDQDFIELFSITFSKWFDIVSISEVNKVIGVLETEFYDVVITDYDMPEIDGISLLKSIREKYPDIPVIFLTGQGNEQIARDAFIFGVSDYYTKDLFGFASKEKILNTVRNLIEKRETEKNLRESEALYRLLFETSPDAISLFNSDGKIIFRNTQALKLFGFEENSEPTGRDTFDFIAYEDLERARKDLRNLNRNTPIRNAEYQFRKKDGEKFIGEINVSMLPGHDGKAKFFTAVIRDVTDRKRNEEDLRYKTLLDTMTNSSRLAFLVVDCHKDKMLYYNSRFLEMWKINHLKEKFQNGTIKNSEIITESAAILAFAQSKAPLLKEEDAETILDEVDFIDGRTIERFSTQIKDENDNYCGRLYVFEDITQKKNMENEIEKLRRKQDGVILKDSV